MACGRPITGRSLAGTMVRATKVTMMHQLGARKIFIGPSLNSWRQTLLRSADQLCRAGDVHEILGASANESETAPFTRPLPAFGSIPILRALLRVERSWVESGNLQSSFRT